MAKKITKKNESLLYKSVAELLQQSRNAIVQSVNTTIVFTYYQIGKLIVEHQQKGNEKAAYGKFTVASLSEKLTTGFGKGFSIDNLENMRKLYLNYSISETVSRKSLQAQQGFQGIELSKGIKSSTTEKAISETVSRKSLQVQQGFQNTPTFTLSWSHYVFLMRIEKEAERQFYEIEASNERWSLRELKRQYDASLYERLALSRNKKKVKELSKKGHTITEAADAIKDPYILDFLGLPDLEAYSENDLETALINKIEDFLVELGKGFLFVGRQYRITIEEDHHHVDLVFYHRILRSFILIDLKMGDLKAEDLGQMQLYVGYFDDEIKDATENKTIGIVLCKNKKESIVKYTLPKDNKQIFTSKYKTYLPAKEEFQLLMEPDIEYNVKKKN